MGFNSGFKGLIMFIVWTGSVLQHCMTSETSEPKPKTKELRIEQAYSARSATNTAVNVRERESSQNLTLESIYLCGQCNRHRDQRCSQDSQYNRHSCQYNREFCQNNRLQSVEQANVVNIIDTAVNVTSIRDTEVNVTGNIVNIRDTAVNTQSI